MDTRPENFYTTNNIKTLTLKQYFHLLHRMLVFPMMFFISGGSNPGPHIELSC